MIFECENCHHHLVNEFCPKCGQRMNVACDECKGRIERITALTAELNKKRDEYKADLQFRTDSYSKDVQELRAKYDRTVEQQRHALEDQRSELSRLRGVEAIAGKRQKEWEAEAWAAVAKTLELQLPIGYVIDEARVLRQLKIERVAASLLRAEVAELKREASTQIDEFAKKREEFMAALQDRNGAKKLEAGES